jgi:heme oxygenase
MADKEPYIPTSFNIFIKKVTLEKRRQRHDDSCIVSSTRDSALNRLPDVAIDLFWQYKFNLPGKFSKIRTNYLIFNLFCFDLRCG